MCLGQPGNESDLLGKIVTSCPELVANLRQAVRKQLVDSLLKNLLQVVRFLRDHVDYHTKSDNDFHRFHCVYLS